MLYQSKVAFVPERREWLAVISNRITRKVVTVGCFHYHAQAALWVADCLRRKAWRNASELPDIYG
jgi:hypothetical protein